MTLGALNLKLLTLHNTDWVQNSKALNHAKTKIITLKSFDWQPMHSSIKSEIEHSFISQLTT